MTLFWYAARTELRRVFTRWQFFSVLVLAAAIYAVFYPQPYLSEALRRVPVAVVDQGGTTASRELIRRVNSSADVSVFNVYPDLAAAADQVYRRTVYGVLLIPRSFERDLLHDRPSPVALYADAGYFLIYQRVSGGVMAAARAIGAEVALNRLVSLGVDPVVAATIADPMPLVAVPLFNPQGGYATYVLPAAFVMILQQLLLMGVGLLATTPEGDVSREVAGWADGCAVVFGKLAAYLLLECVIFPVYLFILPYYYGLPRLGGVADVAAMALPFAIAACGLALVVAAAFRRPVVVQLVLATIGLPFFFLAGFGWPVETMPGIVRAFSFLVPSTFAIDGLVRVSQLGATVSLVSGDYVALWGQALAYVALAVILTVMARRPEKTPQG